MRPLHAIATSCPLLLGLLAVPASAQTTRLVADINKVPVGPTSSNPRGTNAVPASSFAIIGAFWYFSATTDATGTELYRTLGLPGTTRLVADINPGTASSFPRELTLYKGRIWFAALGTSGSELWRTDGTSAGTALVKDLRAGTTSSGPRELTELGIALVFVADDGVAGNEVWKTDGTPAGTVRVKDIQPGSVGSNPWELTPWRGALWFRADDGLHGHELWTTDGTTAGTKMVVDLVPGKRGSGASSLAPSGSRFLWFSAWTPARGHELWFTDGTAAGTKAAPEINQGTVSSVPRELTLSRGRILFSAIHPTRGIELFRIAPGASTQLVGTGCTTTATPPTLDVTDIVLGGTSTARGTGPSTATGAGLILVGFPGSAIDLVGCELYLDLTLPLIPLPLAVKQGSWSVPISVPNDAKLAGTRLAGQALVPGKTALGFDTTNAAFVTIGR